jgi:hypothetical protein
MLTTDVATPLDTNFCKVETGYSYVVEKHMSIPGAMPWAFLVTRWRSKHKPKRGD